ncbi:hypothetical protein [Planomonospora sp. ID82291]|uniref:hypothetical protein n=1 Tax=Planomonospora sp. ID82291 TaxID=2738136 RepID=UPI0018C40DE7|nr:hypothetical protein [Planomonospora sp. ID82291]MBG0818779.1 hypothetical protein [Planomonospora sp. ID82291]
MPQRPGRHIWGIAITIENIPPALMRGYASNPFLTLPDDLRELEDFEDGLVLEILDRLCVRCRKSYDDVAYAPCLAVKDNAHLRGGTKNRAPRLVPGPGQRADEVLARQARSVAHRESSALIQASRLSGLA